jgi:hypothetical protein
MSAVAVSPNSSNFAHDHAELSDAGALALAQFAMSVCGAEATLHMLYSRNGN